MIDYKEMIHKTFSDRIIVLWDDKGSSATVLFVTEDQTAIALAMPEAILKVLREDISRALADKTQPTADR